MTLKAGRGLKLVDPDIAGKILRHPVQQKIVARIAELITQMRACEKPSDLYEFQRSLFGDIYRVEERRAQCSRMDLRGGLSSPLPVIQRLLNMTPGQSIKTSRRKRATTTSS